MKDKLQELLKAIVMGRPAAAEELADILAPLFDKEEPKKKKAAE